MNRDYEIYKARADEIPLEDTARLDGYLEAKAEATRVAQLEQSVSRAGEAMAASIRKPVR